MKRTFGNITYEYASVMGRRAVILSFVAADQDLVSLLQDLGRAVSDMADRRPNFILVKHLEGNGAASAALVGALYNENRILAWHGPGDGYTVVHTKTFREPRLRVGSLISESEIVIIDEATDGVGSTV